MRQTVYIAPKVQARRKTFLGQVSVAKHGSRTYAIDHNDAAEKFHEWGQFVLSANLT
ncbi:uncharacterized protein PHALS_09770 [Plasmopara halstedii]|uniref:Uncharacterized protein n=1 Tax=Plasmopara halstedii TaxID=4781 RepID=A0A0P1AFW3_PLAHL|nr:uncharacterized protein PHALS_09770 [Plasmopara halstedii]CEG39528.1 hypothetical protein PHALS_09770 [Plasmopara halstedii]|eukprot:XP_024575897.1 hypothetical protein PHALS_09770 [Plasmopara halstedii]